MGQNIVIFKFEFKVVVILLQLKCLSLGAYLIYVYWSDKLIGGTPYKISATMKGAGNKVKISGPGLKGGYVGQDLRVTVDTQEAGNGKFY